MQLVSDADLVQLISLFIMTTSCRLLFGVYCGISSATMTVVTAPNHVMLNFTSRAVDRQVNDAIISYNSYVLHCRTSQLNCGP